MTVPHHGIADEFPEYSARIDQLIAEDSHFARLHETYEGLTAQIEELENEGLPISDEEIEKLKMQRLRLKDEIYALLRA